MNFSSLHTHTLYCDGRNDIETMCQSAFERGLISIGFSAHAPIYNKTGIKTNWHLKDDKLEEYINEVRAARKRWNGKLTVFLGLEIDYIKDRCSALDKDIRCLELDFIIGSLHYIFPENGEAPFTIDGSPEELEDGIKKGFGGDNEAMMHAYWDTLAEMINLGGFDILGHADALKKNNKNGRFFDMEGEAWQRRITGIADAVQKSGCVVELNTGLLNRRYAAEPCPSLPFLRLLRERNVPILITADAHRAEDLDGNYNIALENLLSAGYATHVLFEGRSTGRAIWRKENLSV